MAKLITLLAGLTLSVSLFAAELVQPSNNCEPQLKRDFCVNNFCVVNSPISEEPNCPQICAKCAKEACELYGEQSSVCAKISL